MTEIRLGTIGSGKIVHSILDAAGRCQGIRLEAVCSRTKEKGNALAEAYGCRKVYTDMDEFLADPGINTVYIASPNLLHYEQAEKVLQAGKHALVEKPFCTKEEQAEELINLAESRGLYLLEMSPVSFLPNFRVLREHLPEIGRIRLVQGNYSQYSSRYDQLLSGEMTNIFNPAFGGGCLLDINFYNVCLNAALFGRPLDQKYYPNKWPGAADTSGILVLDYGSFKSESCGAKDTWGVNFVEIEGEKGFIYIDGGSNGLKSIRVVTKETDRTYNEQSDPDRLYYEMQEVTHLFRNDLQSEINARHALIKDEVHVLEHARIDAGIYYPGDKEYKNQPEHENHG